MPLVLLLTLALETPLGLPVTVDYGLPDGYTAGAAPSGEAFSVISADSGFVTIVPLQLDTLALPSLQAFLGTDTVMLPGPVLLVQPLIPDSALTPAFAPAPALMSIPPGFPLDYLHQRSFWRQWGGPPAFPWLIVAAGVVLLACALYFILSRRRRAAILPGDGLAAEPPSDSRVMMLLEGESFVHGDWKALYAEIDAMLRALVARRFGLGNPALTLYQMERTLMRDKASVKFADRARPLMREIVLQIYANRGSTREKSRGFIELLAELTREAS